MEGPKCEAFNCALFAIFTFRRLSDQIFSSPPRVQTPCISFFSAVRPYGLDWSPRSQIFLKRWQLATRLYDGTSQGAETSNLTPTYLLSLSWDVNFHIHIKFNYFVAINAVTILTLDSTRDVNSRSYLWSLYCENFSFYLWLSHYELCLCILFFLISDKSEKEWRPWAKYASSDSLPSIRWINSW